MLFLYYTFIFCSLKELKKSVLEHFNNSLMKFNSDDLQYKICKEDMINELKFIKLELSHVNKSSDDLIIINQFNDYLTKIINYLWYDQFVVQEVFMSYLEDLTDELIFFLSVYQENIVCKEIIDLFNETFSENDFVYISNPKKKAYHWYQRFFNKLKI